MKHKFHNHNCQCETEIVKVKCLLKCIQNCSCSKGIAAWNSNVCTNILMRCFFYGITYKVAESSKSFECGSLFFYGITCKVAESPKSFECGSLPGTYMLA